MRDKRQQVIALLTDFGLQDTYVGIMKGVIASIAPQASVIDLTHSVAPQHIRHGALLLGSSSEWFPEGTVFVAVVDPGVGTSRRPIAVETDRAVFIAPDNGLLSIVLTQQCVRSCTVITRPQFMLPNPGATFHGRDLFSPAAAHVASGASPQELGTPVSTDSCVILDFPAPSTGDGGTTWDGEVLYSDIYGNLITSLKTSLTGSDLMPGEWSVRAGDHLIAEIQRTYGDVSEGATVAYTGSTGLLEIAIRNGNAARTLGLQEGDRVSLVRDRDPRSID